MSVVSDPSRCSIQIQLEGPSFVPGSCLKANIAIRVPLPEVGAQQSSSTPSIGSSAPTTPLVASTSAIHNSDRALLIGSEPTVVVDYLVCQVSGRWSTEQAWIKANAHDNIEDFVDGSKEQVKLSENGAEAKPWDAALADGNMIGGGGRAGYSGLIFRSDPHMVCESEQLVSGGQISFAVECILPDCIPLSLRGAAIRYSYALIVVAAVRNASDPALSTSPRIIRVPFRVVTKAKGKKQTFGMSNANGSYSPSQQDIIPVPTPPNVGPRPNIFLEEDTRAALDIRSYVLKNVHSDDIEIALAFSLNGRLTPYRPDKDSWKTEEQQLEQEFSERSLNSEEESPPSIASTPRSEDKFGDVTPHKSHHRSNRKPLPVYSISRSNHLVARMFLAKSVHRLGDTLSALFDFSDQQLTCHRLTARLEVQEIISAKHALGTKHNRYYDDEDDEDDTSVSKKKDLVFRKIFGDHDEVVRWNRNTDITFSIPCDAPVSFATDVVHIKWFIHFTFYTSFDEAHVVIKEPKDGKRSMSETGDETGSGEKVDGDDSNATEQPVEEVATLFGRLFSLNRTRAQKTQPEMQGRPSEALGKKLDVLHWTFPLHVVGDPEWGSGVSATMYMT